MSHAFGRRSGILAALLVVVVAGVALAQTLGDYQPPTAEGSNALKLRVMLTDGQWIELNCARVDIAFPSGGQLHVTENGALPVTPTPPATRHEDAAWPSGIPDSDPNFLETPPALQPNAPRAEPSAHDPNSAQPVVAPTLDSAPLEYDPTMIDKTLIREHPEFPFGGSENSPE